MKGGQRLRLSEEKGGIFAGGSKGGGGNSTSASQPRRKNGGAGPHRPKAEGRERALADDRWSLDVGRKLVSGVGGERGGG